MNTDATDHKKCCFNFLGQCNDCPFPRRPYEQHQQLRIKRLDKRNMELSPEYWNRAKPPVNFIDSALHLNWCKASCNKSTGECNCGLEETKALIKRHLHDKEALKSKLKKAELTLKRAGCLLADLEALQKVARDLANNYEEACGFINYITLRLQSHRSLNPQAKDGDFQEAYKLYVRHNVNDDKIEKSKALSAYTSLPESIRGKDKE